MTAQPDQSMRLHNTDIPTRTVEIPHAKLQFYVDNPRIYSIVRAMGAEPTQEEICTQLQQLEHVKVLKDDIRDNGGLIDPLIVRDGDFVVLEGNSRLAAIRWLATKEAVRWAKVKCTLLPADIDERLVFALLGQYHVKGKKDWLPFEKAGFLFRRYKNHKLELATVATELGIPKSEAAHLVRVYQFMLDHEERERERWSYYDEYLKSRKIEKARQEFPDFDDFIVGEIRSGRIPTAMELRDRLPVICAGPTKTLRRYATAKLTFEDAYEASVDAGGDNSELKKLRRFRHWLALADTEEDLCEAKKAIRDALVYELKEIEKRARKLKQSLEKVASSAN